jgi:alpha-tubulin suppressor-like RCC1 family protein
MSAGAAHTCGVADAGTLFCWGANTRLELGAATTEGCGASGACSTTPVVAADPIRFVSVAAGPAGSCGVVAGQDVFCWGEVVPGDAPDGPRTPRRIALAARTVAVGGDFVCYGPTFAAARCTGGNRYGQLGLGTSGPGSAEGPVAGGQVFWLVTAGERHACGLTNEGSAYCWGANDRGQLGSQTGAETCGGVSCSPRPAPVAGGLTFIALSAGLNHTCGVATGGVALCWGRNATGQLGNGGTTDASVPTPVAGGRLFASIAAAGLSADAGHSCAVATDGAAYCWGASARGELGTAAELPACPTPSSAAYSCARTPQPVAGGIVFSRVTAGRTHTCGIARRDVAYCWGENSAGQLGDGTRTDRPAPVRVADPK